MVEAAAYPVVMCPFVGQLIPVTLRRLNYAQIRSCGNYSMISTAQDHVNAKSAKHSMHALCELTELQHKIVKLTLVSPTYEEIVNVIIRRLDVEPLGKQMTEIREAFDKLEDGQERQQLQEEFAILEMQAKWVLPPDFVVAVLDYGLSRSNSDIDLVTEDMLYEAACRASLGRDNPSDHLSGNFTDFNREDINNRAWIIYHDRHKAK